MALAIFDLDETLISTDSDHEWGQYVADAGLVDAVVHRQRNDEFYEQYRVGKLDINAYLAFTCSVLTRHPLDLLHQHRAEFVESRIKPKVLPRAIDLVNSHRDQGNYVMVITATIEFITRPIVDLFGIETLLAPIPEFADGRYTGAIAGVPAFGAGKVTRLKSWLKDSDHDLGGSFFYSDSHNDLPLLKQVDNPIAVDPDPILKQEAAKNRWSVVSLR